MKPNKEMLLNILANLPNQTFERKPWLIIFYSNASTDEKNAVKLIEEEFQIFRSISYNSRVYVQVVTKTTPNIPVCSLEVLNRDILK